MQRLRALVPLLAPLLVGSSHAAAPPKGPIWRKAFLMTTTDKLGRAIYVSPRDARAPIQILDRGEIDEAVWPDGRHFVMRLPRRDSVPAEADLWIGNIDGTGFEQLTDAKAVTHAAWSPDGRYLAYKVDTGRSCSTAGYGVGTCDPYDTPASLRRVKGLDGQPGSETFRVRNREGKVESLGRSVPAWTA